MDRRVSGRARVLAACAAWLAAAAAHAGGAEYLVPENGDNVVGTVTTTIAQHEDTLLDIGRRYSVGYEEIIAANPGVDPWLPGEGTEILIPSRFILPDAPREGIVVNLPEHRLYYYPPVKPGERQRVITYPISTGKMDWKTPLGVTRVVAKQERPNWYPPASVREARAAKGEPPLPPVVPPGPDNPLGEHALRLGIPSGAYLIHGTNVPAGVGMQVTHGCIRMFPEDISELYRMVPVNTKVNLVDQPTKLGWLRGTLYVERHALMEGASDPGPGEFEALRARVGSSVEGRPVDVDWDAVSHAFGRQSGVPAPVSSPKEKRRGVAAASFVLERASLARLLAHRLLERAIDLLVRRVAAGLGALGSLQRLVGGALRRVGGARGARGGGGSGFRGRLGGSGVLLGGLQRLVGGALGRAGGARGARGGGGSGLRSRLGGSGVLLGGLHGGVHLGDVIIERGRADAAGGRGNDEGGGADGQRLDDGGLHGGVFLGVE